MYIYLYIIHIIYIHARHDQQVDQQAQQRRHAVPYERKPVKGLCSMKYVRIYVYIFMY